MKLNLKQEDFKFILIGDSAVGKSCLLKRLVDSSFENLHETTIGVEFGSKILDIKCGSIFIL